MKTYKTSDIPVNILGTEYTITVQGAKIYKAWQDAGAI